MTVLKNVLLDITRLKLLLSKNAELALKLAQTAQMPSIAMAAYQGIGFWKLKTILNVLRFALQELMLRMESASLAVILKVVLSVLVHMRLEKRMFAFSAKQVISSIKDHAMPAIALKEATYQTAISASHAIHSAYNAQM